MTNMFIPVRPCADLAQQSATPASAPGAPECRHESAQPSNVHWHSGHVSAAARARCFGHDPATIWLTGLSGAGKSSIAYELEKLLIERRIPSFVLDGDNLRHQLNGDLGFSEYDRAENIRRAACVARLMNDAGLVVIAALISPLRADRAAAAAIVGADRFIEVHVNTTREVCEARDPKGLYAKARAGTIAQFTGVSAPYEAPLRPAMTLDTGALRLDEAVAALYTHLSVHHLSRQPA